MKLQKAVWVLAAALLLCGAGVRAQGQQSQQNPQPVAPLPPMPPADSGGSNNSNSEPVPAGQYDPSQVVPDTSTLAGVEPFGLGSLQHVRNTFDPQVSFSALGLMGVGSSIQGEAIFSGGLAFNRIWSRYHFSALYSGGENVYQGGGIQDQPFQNVTLMQEIDWARWRIHLRDDFADSEGAAFGGTGMGGPGLIGEFSSTLGSSTTFLGQEFGPAETIQTGLAMRYLNTTTGEVEYSFSQRSAFTVAGSYGILHFTEPGYIDSNSVDGQAGYDYSIDAKNSIAVFGNYGRIEYNGSAIEVQDYRAALAFGRKITGRMSFQAAAGPEQIYTTGVSNGTNKLWTAWASSSLSYNRRRSGFGITFVRGVNSGSGVLFGALSNTVGGSVHHQFTRLWTGTVNGGYAFNRSIVPTGATTVNFNTWFAGANVGRRVGRHAQIGFNYGVTKQYYAVICPVASCGGTAFQQTFGMTVNWHLLPVE